MSSDESGYEGPSRRRAERTRTFMRASILLPDLHPEPWECVVLDISTYGCAIYFEEVVQPHQAAHMQLPGMADPVPGYVVADRDAVKHIGFAPILTQDQVNTVLATQRGKGR